MRPPEDDLKMFMVFQIEEDTEDRARLLGSFEAHDAQDAARMAALGTPSVGGLIARIPFGRYVAFPVEGSVSVVFTLQEKRLSRNGLAEAA